MKKIVMVIAQEGFRDEELLEPKEYFEAEGYVVLIAAPQKGLCKGMLGVVVEATLAIADIDVSVLKALVVVGGVQSPSLMHVPALGNVLVQAKEKRLVIGAICLAPMVLAHFNVLQGMHATVYTTDDSLAMFKEKRVGFLDEEVIVDDWLVTGNGPKAAKVFAENVVDTIRHR